MGFSLIVFEMGDKDGWNSTLFPPGNLVLIAQPNLTQLRIPACCAETLQGDCFPSRDARRCLKEIT